MQPYFVFHLVARRVEQLADVPGSNFFPLNGTAAASRGNSPFSCDAQVTATTKQHANRQQACPLPAGTSMVSLVSGEVIQLYT